MYYNHFSDVALRHFQTLVYPMSCQKSMNFEYPVTVSDSFDIICRTWGKKVTLPRTCDTGTMFLVSFQDIKILHDITKILNKQNKSLEAFVGL